MCVKPVWVACTNKHGTKIYVHHKAEDRATTAESEIILIIIRICCLNSSKSLSAIIWTTTPWTLVANRAICYNPQLKYSIVTLSNMGEELYLIGSGLIEGLEKTLGVEIQRHLEFDGKYILMIDFI